MTRLIAIKWAGPNPGNTSQPYAMMTRFLRNPKLTKIHEYTNATMETAR